METKKISFGFMKTKKQEKPEIEEKREYIECVEEKSIKVIGGEAVKEDVPLIIPMKPNTLVTAERLKEIAEKVESALDEPVVVKSEEIKVDEPPVNETLEQMAARELLQEAKQQKVVEQPTLMVPLPAKPVMDGEKESTLDDYESVPIQEFGLAMLRGMGWTPGQEQSTYKQPQLRPKGLGLGADKVVSENQKKKTSKDKDEELAIVKGSFVKVTTGKYNGCYGKVVSLDEDNGRVMIDIAMKKEMANLSEFMMQPVTKSEFDKQAKVLNAESYREYKKNESGGSKILKESSSSRESTSSHRKNEVTSRDNTRERERRKDDRSREREDDRYSNGKNRSKEDRVERYRNRNNSSSDDEASQRNKRKEHGNQDSPSSDSDRKVHRKKKRHSSPSSSDSSEANVKRKHKSKSSKNSKEKRDIDKKRKGKKKKRDRDRSPNYRKHKK